MDGWVLNTRAKSRKPPDKTQLITARIENMPSSEVERGVKKQDRQTKTSPAVLNVAAILSGYTGVNDQRFTLWCGVMGLYFLMILHVVELLILPVNGQQFIMSTVFDDGTVLDNYDPVGSFNG